MPQAFKHLLTSSVPVGRRQSPVNLLHQYWMLFERNDGEVVSYAELNLIPRINIQRRGKSNAPTCVIHSEFRTRTRSHVICSAADRSMEQALVRRSHLACEFLPCKTLIENCLDTNGSLGQSSLQLLQQARVCQTMAKSVSKMLGQVRTTTYDTKSDVRKTTCYYMQHCQGLDDGKVMD